MAPYKSSSNIMFFQSPEILNWFEKMIFTLLWSRNLHCSCEAKKFVFMMSTAQLLQLIHNKICPPSPLKPPNKYILFEWSKTAGYVPACFINSSFADRSCSCLVAYRHESRVSGYVYLWTWSWFSHLKILEKYKRCIIFFFFISVKIFEFLYDADCVCVCVFLCSRWSTWAFVCTRQPLLLTQVR